MSRPTKFANKRAMNLMLTDEAREKLKKAAAKRAVSPSDYINMMILKKL